MNTLANSQEVAPSPRSPFALPLRKPHTPAMKTHFQPLPDGEPPLDVKQFLFRLQNEPGFAEKMQAHYETMLATPHSPETAEMHRAATAALRTLKHHQGAWKAMKALQEAAQLANPAAGPITDEALRRIRTLTSDSTAPVDCQCVLPAALDLADICLDCLLPGRVQRVLADQAG